MDASENSGGSRLQITTFQEVINKDLTCEPYGIAYKASLRVKRNKLLQQRQSRHVITRLFLKKIG